MISLNFYFIHITAVFSGELFLMSLSHVLILQVRELQQWYYLPPSFDPSYSYSVGCIGLSW